MVKILIADDFPVLREGLREVLSNVMPKECVAMTDACMARDFKTAAQWQCKFMGLINALFSEVNPIPVKEALAQMGMIEANYRMPLCPMADDTRTALTDALKGAGLLD